AYKRVHQCKLPRMIELEARNAFSGRCDGRFRELSQLTAINEGFQNVLLDVEVVIVDLRQRFLESRQIFDGFVDAVIVDVIARGLGPQDDVIANVLLDEAVAIVAANHRIWKVYVLDLGLQFAPILLGDLATEDHGDLIRLPDRSIGIEQALAKIIQCRAAVEDEVVAIFDLREEQPVLAVGVLAFSCSEEGQKAVNVLLAISEHYRFSGRGRQLNALLGSRHASLYPRS